MPVANYNVLAFKVRLPCRHQRSHPIALPRPSNRAEARRNLSDLVLSEQEGYAVAPLWTFKPVAHPWVRNPIFEIELRPCRYFDNRACPMPVIWRGANTSDAFATALLNGNASDVQAGAAKVSRAFRSNEPP